MKEIGTFRSVVFVIVMSIITCGIYIFIWIYKTSKEVQRYLEKVDMAPGLEVFLSIICFPYLIYWSYKYGKEILRMQGIDSRAADDNTILYVLLSAFGLFIVTMAIMQDQLNKVWSVDDKNIIQK